jgi:ribosomal protein L44E
VGGRLDASGGHLRHRRGSLLKAELPGFGKDDVSVELKDNALTLKGQRKHEMEMKDEQYVRRERMYGSFQRVFMLPAPVDQEKVTATYKDGVLVRMACWSCGCLRVRRPSRSASPSVGSGQGYHAKLDLCHHCAGTDRGGDPIRHLATPTAVPVSLRIG